MKIQSTLFAVAATLALCSQSFGGDLLDRMLGMGGCGCQTSCCDAPAAGPGCGNDFAMGGCDTGCDTGCRPKLVDFRFKINWQAMPRPAFNFLNRGCNLGCGSVGGCDSGCGTSAPACGSDVISAPMMSIGDSGCGSCGAPAASCGCGSAPLLGGCDTGCGPSLQLFSRLRGLRGRIANRPRLFGNCGLGACGGCDTGCDSGCGSTFAPMAGPGCGSDMPAVQSSGCSGCGGSAPSYSSPAPMTSPTPVDAMPVQPAPMVDPNA